MNRGGEYGGEPMDRGGYGYFRFAYMELFPLSHDSLCPACLSAGGLADTGRMPSHKQDRIFCASTLELYACLAKAWIEDQDAVPNKLAAYYTYVVKH